MRMPRATVLAFLLCASAQSRQPPIQDQATGVGAKQQSDDWLKTDYPAETDEQRAEYCSFLFAPTLTDSDCPDTPANKADVGDERSEFWAAFGHRFKITDSLLVVFTAFLAAYTIRLFYATRRLAEGGEDTARRQLRAYINVSAKKLENVIESRVPRFVLTAKNFGQTPALNVRTLHGCRIVESAELGEFHVEPINPNKKEGSRSILAPDSTESSESFLHEARKRVTLGGSLWGELNFSGKKRISIDGWIEYEDVFGQRHWTKFRLLSAGTGQKAALRWAPNGNEVGTYKKSEKSGLDEWIARGVERVAAERAKLGSPESPEVAPEEAGQSPQSGLDEPEESPNRS